MPKSSKKKKDELPTPMAIGETFPPDKDPIPSLWIPPPPGIGQRVF